MKAAISPRNTLSQHTVFMASDANRPVIDMYRYTVQRISQPGNLFRRLMVIFTALLPAYTGHLLCIRLYGLA